MMSVTPCRLLGEDVFGTIRLAKELSPNVRVNSWLCTPRQETGRADVEEDLSQADYIRVYRYQQELDGVQCAECPAESLPEPGGPVRGGVVRGLRCGGERSSFSVNWRGVMSPCNELEMIETYPLRDGFDQAWQEVHRAVLEWPRAAACEGCAYAPVCVPCAGRLLRYGEPGTCPADLCGQTMRYVQQGVYSIPACE